MVSLSFEWKTKNVKWIDERCLLVDHGLSEIL